MSTKKISCSGMSLVENSNPGKALAQILCSLRADLGLRQIDLAEKLGKPQSFISKYESGERRLDLVELNEICRALHISLSEVAARLEQQLNEA